MNGEDKGRTKEIKKRKPTGALAPASKTESLGFRLTTAQTKTRQTKA